MNEKNIDAVIGANIRTIRNDLGLTQTQLARKTGVSQRVISNLEQCGSAGGSSVRILEKIANGLDIPIAMLIRPNITTDRRRIDRFAQMEKNFHRLNDEAQEKILSISNDYLNFSARSQNSDPAAG